jgi:acetyltransferase-like isoleucine patch superfamily enzyme
MMLSRLAQRAVRHWALNHGKYGDTYRRFCNPDGAEFAQYLKRYGGFISIGADCFVSPRARITDPGLVRIGNNVRISDCTIFGHDGSVNMVNRAYGLRLDSVGPVDIKDNVFLAHGCIIQPRVVIGPNAIVGAGSVVVRDVPPGTIVSGVPARPVGTLDMAVSILKAKNAKYPWRELIEGRVSTYDPELEPTLLRMRQSWFFPEISHERATGINGTTPPGQSAANGPGE